MSLVWVDWIAKAISPYNLYVVRTYLRIVHVAKR
jgi:hypothetical protein